MKTQQLEIYVDLDHTALDTAAFKQYLAESLGGYGVSVEAFLKAYWRVRNNGSFSIPKLVEALQFDQFDREAVVHTLTEKAKGCGQFLYPDVLPFLRRAREKDAGVVLFTYGDRAAQELKLSGLQELVSAVDEVLITPDKDKALPSPPGSVRRVIVDDRPEVLERYVDVEGVVPVLVVRAGIERRPSRLRAYCSLLEVAEMLSKEGLW